MVDSLLGRGNRTGPAKRANRLTRTIVLGAVAVGFAIYWLARSFAVDWAELQSYFVTSVLFVGVFIGGAAVAGGVVWLVKRYR